jgi:hypothetical protein
MGTQLTHEDRETRQRIFDKISAWSRTVNDRKDRADVGEQYRTGLLVAYVGDLVYDGFQLGIESDVDKPVVGLIRDYGTHLTTETESVECWLRVNGEAQEGKREYWFGEWVREDKYGRLSRPEFQFRKLSGRECLRLLREAKTKCVV